MTRNHDVNSYLYSTHDGLCSNYSGITGKKPSEIGHIKCALNVPLGTMCPISICALFKEMGHNVPYLCALFVRNILP